MINDYNMWMEWDDELWKWIGLVGEASLNELGNMESGDGDGNVSDCLKG
jgi:hypothetical protein